MTRLVVVSNRVPDPGRPPTGGLAVAVQAALRDRGGIWMGWSGRSSGDDEPPPMIHRKDGNITYALTDLSDRDLAEYYNGFANSVLWPLCHYRTDLTDFARREAQGYFRVNRLFADRLLPLIREDDVIWVHDYHLLPLADELRRRGVANRIGFFLHIPWPAPDIYLTLPPGTRLLQAMTAFDLLGFQTENDAANFRQCLERGGLAAPVPGEEGLFQTPERRFRLGAFPIGIDTAGFARTARNASRSAALRNFRTHLGAQKLLVGVDRLDYSKGLIQRLNGYRRFLETETEWSGRVSYLQITPRTRSGVAEYEALQREVAELAGQIAGAFGRLDWVPFRYFNRAFSRQMLASIYRMASIALVTPLRDGMNLVAKEFVAAQDPDDPGVLILSQFAGAASELASGALLVNPYDEEAIAQAISRAVAMQPHERRQRHDAMMAVLRGNDVFTWCSSFLDRLAAPRGAVTA